MPITYTAIASTTLTSPSATITLNSIPATYTDLRLVFVGVELEASSISKRIFFNGSTAANYSVTKLGGNGSSAYTVSQSNESGIRFASDQIADGATTPVFSTFDIFSYAGSTLKTVLITTSSDQNGAGYVQRTVGLWSQTAAINSLTLGFLNSSTWAIGSSVTLYGIKAA
jgi:hypothetical protein